MSKQPAAERSGSWTPAERLALASLITAVVLAATALAAAAGTDAARSVNLDSDPEPERIVPQEVCEAIGGGHVHSAQSTCPSDQFSRRRVVIEDTCAGKTSPRSVSSVQDSVDRLRVVEADGRTSYPEVFFDLRSGATGRGGDIRVVHFVYSPHGTCPTPSALFRYPTRSTLGPIPRGAAGRDSFSVFLRDYSKRYRGKEIRLVETYVDRDDPFCCPSFRRVTHFRFSPGAAKYVRYRTRVSRIKR